jgi:hypothetical protein
MAMDPNRCVLAWELHCGCDSELKAHNNTEQLSPEFLKITTAAASSTNYYEM